MKLKNTILLLTSTITLTALAQPVITGIGTSPIGAISYAYTIPGAITPATAGANQTWDYSTVPYDPSSYYIKNVDFSTTSAAIQAAHPTGNLASEMYIGGSLAITVVFRSELNDLLYLGYNTVVFPSPDTQLVYPHSYLETKAGFTYDAYGTMITPFGTFTNVVRLREKSGANYKYDFWQFSPQYKLVMEYMADTTTGAIGGQTFFEAVLPTGIADVATEDPNVFLYPNPSTGMFKVEAADGKKLSLKVFNTLGEMVLRKEEAGEIDLSSYSKGIYFVQITNDGGTFSKRILLE